ncbi:MAG: pimeloyl-ACP methyl ester esterase BioH [Burkholderiales bacterium]|nr:pimeloyl-ACP methyl ester esterase BioH [Burkholderiales bacterium]
MSTLHVDTTGSGRPLVLLHGWAMHGGLFATLVPGMARRFRVSVVDLPGHGYSPPVTPYTLDAIVAALTRRFADDSEPISIVGWSLGGTVALRWAHRHPDRVSRLVLVCATPRFVAGDDWPTGMEPAMYARFGDEFRVAYRLTLQRFLSLQVRGGGGGKATLAALRQELFARGEPQPGVLAAALAVLGGADLRAEVPAIAARTLVVTGDRDALVPTEAGAWLAGAMPAARHVDIGGAAHAPFLSHRAAFDTAVREFLDAG